MYSVPGILTYGALGGKYTLSAPAYTSAGIYRASDTAPKTLLRTLWSNEYQAAGVHTAYWDGLDDNGNDIISTHDYEAVILSHNVTADWSTIGNTSTLNHGGTNYHGYSTFAKLAMNGTDGYCGEYYNEGGCRKGYYFLGSAIQESIDILPASTDPNASSQTNDTNLSTEYNCTDGTNVYWGGIDPGASGYGTSGSWVYGTVISTNTHLAWSSGTSIKAGGGATYPNAISIVINAPTNVITGMATNGTYLWVARGTTNNIYCYSCSTGALLSTTTGFSNPRELAYDSSNGGRVWFLNSTNQMVKATIGGSGALTSGSLTIPDFPANKMTLAVSNVGTAELAVVNGGTDERVWFWDISAGTPGSTNTGQIGQTGGYQSVTLVANDRFQFSGTVTELTKPFLAYDSNKSIYIFDAGGERIQIFDDTRTYVDTIQVLATSYAASVDMNDETRAFVKYLEFEITPSTGAWTYKRNFRAQIPAAYFISQGYGTFQWCSTLSNGLTYATLDDYSTVPTNLYTTIFELTNTVLRNTGVQVNSSGYFEGYLDKDFTIRRLDPPVGSVSSVLDLKERTITSFSSNNPVYSAESTIVSLDPLVAGSPMINPAGGRLAGIVNDVIFVNSGKVGGLADANVQTYKLSTGELITSTAYPTTDASNPPFQGYIGWFPPPHRFDIGNGTLNGAPQAQVSSDYAMVKYYGEFWKSAQTNYHNMFYKNSLAITQFGTNRTQSEAAEISGPESAGNGFGFRFSVYDSDNAVLVHCDESRHSSGHLWHIGNLSSIALQTIKIVPPTFETLPGVTLMQNLTFNSIISTTGNITVSHAQNNGFSAECGTKSWDKYDPDCAVYLDASLASNGDNRYVNLDIVPPYSTSLTSYSMTGQVMFFAYSPENNLDPSSMIQIIDDVGKIIAQIGQGQVIVTDDYVVRCNTTDVISTNFQTDQDTIVNVVNQWQPFVIEVNSTSVTLTYGNYTPVVTTLFDATAHWNKPTSFRTVTERRTTPYGVRGVSAKQVRYIEVI